VFAIYDSGAGCASDCVCVSQLTRQEVRQLNRQKAAASKARVSFCVESGCHCSPTTHRIHVCDSGWRKKVRVVNQTEAEKVDAGAEKKQKPILNGVDSVVVADLQKYLFLCRFSSRRQP